MLGKDYLAALQPGKGPSQLALIKHVLLKSEDTLSLWKKPHPAGVSMPQAVVEASATHLQKAESQGSRNLQKLAKPAVVFFFFFFKLSIFKVYDSNCRAQQLPLQI